LVPVVDLKPEVERGLRHPVVHQRSLERKVRVVVFQLHRHVIVLTSYPIEKWLRSGEESAVLNLVEVDDFGLGSILKFHITKISFVRDFILNQVFQKDVNQRCIIKTFANSLRQNVGLISEDESVNVTNKS